MPRVKKPQVPKDITDVQLFQASIIGATISAFQTSPVHAAIHKEALFDRYVENIVTLATRITQEARARRLASEGTETPPKPKTAKKGPWKLPEADSPSSHPDELVES